MPELSSGEITPPSREDHYRAIAGKQLAHCEQTELGGQITVHEVREWLELPDSLRSALRTSVSRHEIPAAVRGFRLVFPNLQVGDDDLVRL